MNVVAEPVNPKKRKEPFTLINEVKPEIQQLSGGYLGFLWPTFLLFRREIIYS